jgi:hypothetical protein
MFLWSKKSQKSVTFNQEVADQSLLEVVEAELMKHPQKTFSDLCKDALWQFLCVPESVRPTRRMANSQEPTPELQRQLAEFENRFLAMESKRLDAIERQLNQLSQQVAQLAFTVNNLPKSSPAPSPQLESQAEAVTPTTPPQEVDPLLNRLSQVLDDF